GRWTRRAPGRPAGGTASGLASTRGARGSGRGQRLGLRRPDGRYRLDCRLSRQPGGGLAAGPGPGDLLPSLWGVLPAHVACLRQVPGGGQRADGPPGRRASPRSAGSCAGTAKLRGGVMRASTYPLVDAAEAAAVVLERTPVLPAEDVALADCPGRVLTDDLIAPAQLPPFAASAVDGFAIRSADGGGPPPPP